MLASVLANDLLSSMINTDFFIGSFIVRSGNSLEKPRLWDAKGPKRSIDLFWLLGRVKGEVWEKVRIICLINELFINFAILNRRVYWNINQTSQLW